MQRELTFRKKENMRRDTQLAAFEFLEKSVRDRNLK